MEGSTRVIFVVGDQDAILDPVSEQVDATFWSIVEGMGTNERPLDVTDTVAAAVDRLVIALAKAAREVEVSLPGRKPQTLRTNMLSREPWQRRGGEEAGEVSVHGMLEMVDLHTARFRLRDAAGNAIDLHEVAEPEEAARLVGTRIVATGVLAVGQGTQHHRMEIAHVAAEESVQKRLGIQPPASVDALRQQARAVPTPEPLDLSDDELDDFLAEIRA